MTSPKQMVTQTQSKKINFLFYLKLAVPGFLVVALFCLYMYRNSKLENDLRRTNLKVSVLEDTLKSLLENLNTSTRSTVNPADARPNFVASNFVGSPGEQVKTQATEPHTVYRVPPTAAPGPRMVSAVETVLRSSDPLIQLRQPVKKPQVVRVPSVISGRPSKTVLREPSKTVNSLKPRDGSEEHFVSTHGESKAHAVPLVTSSRPSKTVLREPSKTVTHHRATPESTVQVNSKVENSEAHGDKKSNVDELDKLISEELSELKSNADEVENNVANEVTVEENSSVDSID